jgi:phosphate butyryltransferase
VHTVAREVDLFRSFTEIRCAARGIPGARVAVPMGHDVASLESLIMAVEEGLSTAVILAPAEGVVSSLAELGRNLPPEIEIVDISDEEAAAVQAVRMVSSGEATMLMKGMLKTSIFQKAVLDREFGLRTGRILSHVAVVHAPRQDRLIAISDGGMNIRPDEESFRQIAVNAAGIIEKLGIEPLVALLAAVEVENEKMPETVMFAKLAREGIPGLAVDGPMAVDGAIDPEAAAIKKMSGPVAGRATVLITPDISSGNIFAKAFMYMTDAEVGGLIAGASAPVVMLSRSDRSRTKLNSLALGVVVAGGGNV